jgi:hypothetical protein
VRQEDIEMVDTARDRHELAADLEVIVIEPCEYMLNGLQLGVAVDALDAPNWFVAQNWSSGTMAS